MSINNKYYIYNSNNNLYLEATSRGIGSFLDKFLGSIISIGHTICIKRLDQTEFSTIKKKVGVISGEYNIYYGDENMAQVKQNMVSFKPKISIVTKKSNYLVVGDIMGIEFNICNNGKTVARISKTAFNIKDKYKIDIFDEENEELFLSAVIAIDVSVHN